MEDRYISEDKSLPLNTPKIKFGNIVVIFLHLGMTFHSEINATVLFAAKLPVAGKEMVRFATVMSGL